MNARILNYVDSSREPPNQTFRAVVESAVVHDAGVLGPAGAKAVLRLVKVRGIGGRPELTLNFVGVQIGTKWAAVHGSFEAPVAQAEIAGRVIIEPTEQPVELRGVNVLVPGKTRLVFRFQDGARLVPENL